MLVESTITDCGSIIFMNPTQVAGLGTYASVYEDYNNPPPANQGYYIAIDVYGIGNACSGQAVDIAVTLPANTQLNISAATPVHCIPLLTQNNQIVNGPPDTSGGCPQASHGGSERQPTAFRMGANTGFFATTFYPFWGIAIGSGIEMQIPVVSSAALPAPNSLVTGVITVADGNSNPTLAPDGSGDCRPGVDDAAGDGDELCGEQRDGEQHHRHLGDHCRRRSSSTTTSTRATSSSTGARRRATSSARPRASTTSPDRSRTRISARLPSRA